MSSKKSSLQRQKYKQSITEEAQQRIPPDVVGQELLCLAKLKTEDHGGVSWEWKNIAKFIQRFCQDNQQILHSFLNHKITAGFIGTQHGIIKFLENRGIRSKNFEPKDFLQIKNEGIYLLQVGREESYLIVWPDREFYQQPALTQQLTNIVLNLCEILGFVMAIDDNQFVFSLKDCGQQTENLNNQCTEGSISSIHDFQVFHSGTILIKQDIFQNKTVDDTALVLERLQQIYDNKIAIEFTEDFWSPIKQYLSSGGHEMPFGHFMVLSSLLPKLGFQLHEALLEGFQAIVDSYIKKIEQICKGNHDTSQQFCQIGVVDYNEENEETKMKISEYVSQNYTFAQSDLKRHQTLQLNWKFLEVFWVKDQFFSVIALDNVGTAVNVFDKEIWQDRNCYDFVVYAKNILVCYNAAKKLWTILELKQGIMGAWYCDKQPQINKSLTTSLAQLYQPVQSIHITFDDQDKACLLVQTTSEIIKGSLFGRSQVERVQNIELLGCNSLLTIKPGVLFKTFFEDSSWHIDVLTLTSSKLEVMQTIKNIPIPKNLQKESTYFTTFCDDDDEEYKSMYLIAITHNGIYELSYVTLEIIEKQRMHVVYNAVPWDHKQLGQKLLFTAEHKDIKKLIPKDLEQFSFDEWKQLKIQSSQAFPIERLLFNCPQQSLSLQDQSIVCEELQKGDTVWYFSADSVWIATEILELGLSNKTFKVRTVQGEVMTEIDNLRRRYSGRGQIQIPSICADITEAFASYSYLLCLSLDCNNSNKQEVISRTVWMFERVTQYYCKGNLSYGCLLHLYEVFRKVMFTKDQKDLRQILEMLDTYPAYLDYSKIHPPFQPAIDHIEMILKVFEAFTAEKFRTALDLNFDIPQNLFDNREKLQCLRDECFQVTGKSKKFFIENQGILSVESILVVYNQIIAREQAFQSYVNTVDKAMDNYFDKQREEEEKKPDQKKEQTREKEQAFKGYVNTVDEAMGNYFDKQREEEEKNPEKKKEQTRERGVNDSFVFIEKQSAGDKTRDFDFECIDLDEQNTQKIDEQEKIKQQATTSWQIQCSDSSFKNEHQNLKQLNSEQNITQFSQSVHFNSQPSLQQQLQSCTQQKQFLKLKQANEIQRKSNNNS